MRALVQRVTSAAVAVDGEVVGEIGHGLLALVGVTHDDDAATAAKLADRIYGLRVFNDDHATMNLSCADVGGSVLVVSQFTLYADTSRGRRPSWIDAARPEHAEPLINQLVDALQQRGAPTATGRFRAHMQVSLVNDGPVTVLLEV